MNPLGKLIDKDSGEVLVELNAPPNALSDGADRLSEFLYALTETLSRGYGKPRGGGELGGEFGYGVEFENEVFSMHPYCWCEKDECQWCSGNAPNFIYKPTGLSVKWYKWIGRDMEVSAELTGEKFGQLIKECFDSIPVEVREKSIREHDEQNTPEYLAKREHVMSMMFEAMCKVIDSQTPCWACSESGEIRGGSLEFGAAGCVAKTMHDDAGACSNCGHVNTEGEDAYIAARQKDNNRAFSAWGLKERAR